MTVNPLRFRLGPVRPVPGSRVAVGRYYSTLAWLNTSLLTSITVSVGALKPGAAIYRTRRCSAE